MPKETFFNLKGEKRNKIENALLAEFGRTSFSKASITNIISKAGIPRGSFYQYFEDKEDAIKYVMKKYIVIEKENIKNFLKETDGDIFEASLKIFDYMVSRVENETEVHLYKNIFQELKKNNVDLFDENINEKEQCSLLKLVDTEKFNIKNVEDLKYIMKIISTITRAANIDVTSKKINKIKARGYLEKQFEIIKRGALK